MPIIAVSDWAGDYWSYAYVWGLPSLAIIMGVLTSESIRALIWSIALAWMGIACLINAHRCRRTHCQFTGPFYLCMIFPVVIHGLGIYSLGDYAWWVLGVAILLGGKIIWWVTESIWGKYSTPEIS